MKFQKKTLNINGADRTFVCNPEEDTLASVLRRLGLTGTKIGCGTGVCGACSVILDGKVIRSCTRKIKAVEDYSEVITIEGVGTPMNMHPLQVAWIGCGAVQCGFCIPGFIVSAYGLLQENINPTREDVRDWFQKHRNVCRCTGYKQIVDAVMAAAAVMRGEKTVEEIKYQNPDNKEFYGTAVGRPTGPAKVCGVADYGDDIELKMPPGTLHVVLVQPRVASHAKILSINTAEAEKMPGVFKVITHKDVKGTGQADIFAGTPRNTGINARRNYLAVDKINMYGDVVAMVAADTKENAKAAAEKVTVDIEQLPEYTNYLDAVMPDAMRIHESTDNIYAEWPMFKGDIDEVDEIIESAENTVEGSFYSTREPHMSIEGDTVQAYFDEDDNLTVQCKSQAVYWNKSDIAQAAGVDVDKVRVIMNPSGASFGWSVTAATFSLAGIAAVATGMPIALSITYEEYMHFSGKRSACHMNGRLACDNEGKIKAAEFDFGIDHGAYTELGADLINRPIRYCFFPYKVPKALGLSRVAVTNHGFGTAYRGYGSPQAYTMSEAMMDIMAEKLNMDPFEIRWKNIAHPGDTNLQGYEFQQYPMEEMMTKLKPLYEAAVKKAKEEGTPEKRRGVGISWGGYNVSETPSDVAEVALELNPDGTVTKFDTWQELGQGGDIGSLMVTLEALKPLGITPEQVKLVQNDTKNCPDSGIAASSRSHFMNGKATISAAEKLLDAMKKDDGTYRTYDEMIEEKIPTKYFGNQDNSVEDNLAPMDPNTGIGSPSISYTYSLYMAEVEVDTATGKTTILKYTCIDDVGVIGNIQAMEGQAYGGISHSMGFALSEDYKDVKKHNNIYSCGIPYIKDVPDDITLIHCQNPREVGPFGSSGASEAFQSGGHVAVINAIKNACGVRIYELPATPEKVKAGIDALAKGEEPEKPGKYYLGPDMHEQLEKIKANPL